MQLGPEDRIEGIGRKSYQTHDMIGDFQINRTSRGQLGIDLPIGGQDRVPMAEIDLYLQNIGLGKYHGARGQ